MPLPVITDIHRVAVRGTTHIGTPWVNVLHFRFAGGPPTSTEIGQLKTELDKLYGGPAYVTGSEWLLKRALTSVALADYTFTRLDGSSASVILGSTKVGSDTSQGVPAEVCNVLTLRTNLRGRSHRGRIYLPPYGIGTYDSVGNLGATIRDNIVLHATNFLAAVPALGWAWVVASYHLGTYTVVSAVTMDLKADVQRRRKA